MRYTQLSHNMICHQNKAVTNFNQQYNVLIATIDTLLITLQANGIGHQRQAGDNQGIVDRVQALDRQSERRFRQDGQPNRIG